MQIHPVYFHRNQSFIEINILTGKLIQYEINMACN